MSDPVAATPPAAQEAPRNGSKRALAVAAWYGEIAGRTSGSRAVFARLRRCPSPEAAACEPEAHDLARRLSQARGGRSIRESDMVRAGFIAGILSHVKEDLKGRSLGAALAAPRGEKPSKDAPPRLSRARFVRLCETQHLSEAYPAFRRIVAILDDKAPVESLGGFLASWGDEGIVSTDPTGRRTYGDEARIRLAGEYYGAS